MTLERRVLSVKMAIRKASDGGPSVISGLGAVYNTETVIGGWFREQIAPGAFASVISSTSDVRSLFNHDPNHVLGRTASKSLRLRDTDDGLAYEVDINPDDPDACSVGAKIARGDVTGSSFGFVVATDGDEWDDSAEDMLPLRTIRSIRSLLDIGPVTFPAYDEATSSARDMAQSLVDKRLVEARNVPANVSLTKADPDTAWSKPNLSDFTDKAWTDLKGAEQTDIAGHYAWRGGPAFADLSLPHHRPSDGAIVLKGVVAAAGRLNQTDGINEAAVKAHLEAHYHAFGLKAPWEDDSKAAQDAVEARLRDDDRLRRLRFAEATR